MALELFDFPFHSFETQNPESGFRGQFGGSYVFTSPPIDPDQRIFKLTFAAMQYFTDQNDDIDNSVNPRYNMKTLTDFYIDHKLHKSLQYYHPVHGTLEVKFNKPLVEPKGKKGGTGVVENVQVELIEIP